MNRNLRQAVMLGVAAAISSTLMIAQSAQPAGQTATAPQTAMTADQQPTAEQLAKLFEVMRLRAQMQSMRQIVPSMVQQQIKSAMQQTESNLPAGTKLTPEQREGMEKVMSKYVGKAMDLYPADEMQTDMTAIYQRHLSREDVDGLIAFYSSAAGQHLLDAQPVIAQEYMPLVMSKVTERSQAMMKEMMKEMSEFVPAKQAAVKPVAKPPAK
ncbi:MAG: DUF2059 domain-containing protein [Terracidiphilus sp.]